MRERLVACRTSVVRRRRRWLLCAGVVFITLVETAATASAIVPAGRSPATGKAFIVRQHGFPPQLVVRGDRVEVGYKARGANQGETPTAAGTLYVRNDLQRTFTAVPLVIRKTLEDRGLWAVVPGGLLTGHRLLYYAVIRDLRTGQSVTLPTRGARAPERVWIVNDALRVQLGAHVFGHTRTGPVVARADPTEVGFGRDGLVFGPSSFEVAKNGSIWLLDRVNNRVLVWAAGHPDEVARTIPIPGGSELALGRAGSLYVLYGSGKNPLTRLSASGKVLWTSRLAAGDGQLRTGPDGTLYWTGGFPSPKLLSNWLSPWMAVATPAGRPLSVATQWNRTVWAQPLRGGLQLVRVMAGWKRDGLYPAPREARLALVDRAGRVVRAWRVESRTIIWWYTDKTPALVAGDPVIVLTASTPSQAATRKLEYLVLRLGPKGEVRTHFALPKDKPPQTAYGDSVATEIRVGPDGALYQLGSAPKFGAAIYRFPLAPSRKP